MVDIHDLDLRFSYDYSWNTSILFILSFYVSKGSTDTQPTRKDSSRPLLGIVKRTIDLSSLLMNPLLLLLSIWFVILTEIMNSLTIIPGENSPTVTYISYINKIIYHKSSYAT
jgi:hypothetical protein